jgi:hypothetical protein
MSTTKLSEAEVHALVIDGIRSMTREEAQSWLDRVAERFGPDEATVASRVANGTPPKRRKLPKAPLPKSTVEVS